MSMYIESLTRNRTNVCFSGLSSSIVWVEYFNCDQCLQLEA